MAVDIAPLDELVEDILDRRGVTPTKLGSDFCDAGHRVISAKLMKDHRLDLSADDARYVDALTYRRWMATSILADDVLLTSEAPLGEVAYVHDDVDWCLGQRLFCIRTDKRKLHGRYLFYCLRGEPARPDLLARATGTTVQGIRQSELRRVGIPVLPLPEQKRIAYILGALDDKIELNRRMNATLEAMSRALFRSWFVDFDPVRQKAAGTQPVGMDAQTAALFPDSFEDSEIGEVPKGWRVGIVGDQYDITMGQSPPGHTYNESGDGLPFFQGRADFGFRYPQRRMFCTAPTRFAAPGDTLVSVRAPVGDLNMALEQCAIGRGVAAVRHKSGASGFSYYGMHALSSCFEKFEGEGTVFGSMGKKDFHGIKAVAAAERCIHAFEQVVAPQNQQIENLERQTASLAALRDTLLPKLLSGEIRVPEAEEAVDEVIG
jgi:type I restriction enzyme S subunit